VKRRPFLFEYGQRRAAAVKEEARRLAVKQEALRLHNEKMKAEARRAEAERAASAEIAMSKPAANPSPPKRDDLVEAPAVAPIGKARSGRPPIWPAILDPLIKRRLRREREGKAEPLEAFLADVREYCKKKTKTGIAPDPSTVKKRLRLLRRQGAK
jgi:hypothetical protein